MDLRMPGMGGLEATRRLRSAGSAVPIIALTASSVEDAPAVARAAGANEVMTKPYVEAALLHSIGAFLNVRYQEASSAAPAAMPSIGAERPLESLLQDLPAELLGQLRDAAAGARARRVEELASEAATHSPEAAAGIRALANDFRYDRLADALAAASAPT
jgi:CheY-like chemotaxis protein